MIFDWFWPNHTNANSMPLCSGSYGLPRIYISSRLRYVLSTITTLYHSFDKALRFYFGESSTGPLFLYCMFSCSRSTTCIYRTVSHYSVFFGIGQKTIYYALIGLLSNPEKEEPTARSRVSFPVIGRAPYKLERSAAYTYMYYN